jgi:hypothetical protein
MSERAVAFVEEWVSENIHAEAMSRRATTRKLQHSRRSAVHLPKQRALRKQK